jgi:hypothetical protein
MKAMYEDPIVNEVRKAREHLAEKYDFDVEAIFEDIQKRQSKLGKRLVRRQKKQVTVSAVYTSKLDTLHSGR